MRREDQQDDEGEHRHADAELDEDSEGEDGGQDAADELDQAGADQVANAFDVGHDARDERAGLVRVVVGDGQAADVLLDLLAQLGDEALAGLGEKLGEGEGGDALNDGRGDDDADDGGSRLSWCLPMTLSMRYFVEAGRTRPQTRLTIISRKLPASSGRQGLMSFQTSGRTFLSFGLGRLA